MDLANQIIKFIKEYKILLNNIYKLEHITHQQASILYTIPFDGININELSLELGLHISTMTRNLCKLESLGLIKRLINNEDKRSIIIVLSKSGVLKKNNIENQHHHSLQAVLASHKDFNKLELSNLLESLTWLIKKFNFINE